MLRGDRRSPQHLAPDTPRGGANRLPDRGPQAALGNNGDMGSRSRPFSPATADENAHPWQDKRRALWALSRTAAGLLYPRDTPPRDLKGVATCRWAVISKLDGVDVNLSSYEATGQRRASFGGLQTCGLVWRCPACAARISETRRRQVNEGLAWAKGQGFRIAMLTLTARHGAGDDLAALLGAIKVAKRMFHRHRAWRRIKPEIVALLTATEVTHGRNGWHPHFHVVVIVRTAEAEAALSRLGDVWRASLRGQGLDGAAAAFDCQNASAAGRYIAKWGAAEELTLGGKKRARSGGKTPLQLLEAAKAGSEGAAALWLEYVAAFHHRNQLDGLKKLVDLYGGEQISDEEAAQDERQDDQARDDEPLLNIDHDTWRSRARSRRTDILDAAETGGAAAVREVIHGPPKPRRRCPDPPVIDEDDQWHDELLAALADQACPEGEEPPDRWTPPPMRPGGLAARAAALIARASPAQAPPGPE